MNLSPGGTRFIQDLEGLRTKAYLDSAGIPTIGFGHTAGVKLGDECTPEDATKYFEDDVAWAVKAVADNTKDCTLSQNEFDALVSFTYNAGRRAFEESTLLRRLKQGRHDEAAGEFERWVFSGGKKISGLLNRRMAEKRLFLGGDDERA